MSSKNKTVISIGNNYSVIICGIGTIMMIVALILPFLLSNPPNFYLKIIWVAVSAFFAMISAMAGILSYQIAILDKSGLIIKSAIKREIVRIKWSDIIKVDVQNLNTLRSTLKNIQVKWIILYTANYQVAKYGGGNRKGHPPWQIIYNKKNINTLTFFLRQYRPDLKIIPLVKL